MSNIKAVRLDWRLHEDQGNRQWWHGYARDEHIATITDFPLDTPAKAHWDVFIGDRDGESMSLQGAQRAVQNALTKALNRLAQ